MQLVVAEKPSVARDLARVLGVRPVGQHCFEGDGRVITWCIGHLVELDEPAAYDPRWKAWRLDTLPMLPAEFRLRPSKHAVAQLRTVTRLLADRRFTSVVNACDAGREGELIFRYVYRFAGGGPPVQRLWISSLTDEAIRRGFAALRPGAQLDPLGDAARSRSEADWLVGMNATRAITARGREAGHSALYSIGRVQTPTLAMLVARELAIQAFVPRAYWEIRGEFRTPDGQRFSAGWRHGALARLATAALADTIATRDRAHGAAADPVGPRVERIRARTVREAPPQLFDLTSLQRTANRRFGFSAARTLEIAQALYERHKILTYPRTDSRHLSSDVVPELPALFAMLAGVAEYAPFANELLAHPPRPGRRIVDDAKVHDHHAIIPTGKAVRLASLDRDEQRVFDLVARRFLGAFYPDAEFAITEAWIRVGTASGAAPAFAESKPATEGEVPLIETLPPPPDRYLARGRVRVAAGWQTVAGIDGGDETRGRGDPPAEASAVLPPLVEGQALDGTFTPQAKQTTPPHRYTEATLLGAMESAGKTIDDEALRAAMKDCGLGTPATRAAVIETLLKRDYIVRTKQQLSPTALGIGLIQTLPVASLASPELTGAWEARLARIARGAESRATFMADIARYVEEIVDAIRGSSPAAPPDTPPVGACPACRANVVERARDFACTGSCGFTMRNRVAGRVISGALAGVLLDKRRSQLLSGFRSRAGKAFAAILVLEDSGDLRFDFASGDRDRDRAPDGREPERPPRAAADRDRSATPAPEPRHTETTAGDRPSAPRAGRAVAGRNGASATTTGDRRSASRSAGATADRDRSPATNTGDRRGASRSAGATADRDRSPATTTGDRRGASRSAVATSDRDRSPATTTGDRRGGSGSARATADRDRSSVATAGDGRRASRRAGATADRNRSPATTAGDRRGASRTTVADRGRAPVTPTPEPRRDDRASSSPGAAHTVPARRGTSTKVNQHPPTSTPLELACPRCQTGSLLAGARGWGCSRWREGCGFVVWFETAGRKLSAAQLRDLVTRGKTRKARFAPDGVDTEGRLVLGPSGGSARFEPA